MDGSEIGPIAHSQSIAESKETTYTIATETSPSLGKRLQAAWSKLRSTSSSAGAAAPRRETEDFVMVPLELFQQALKELRFERSPTADELAELLNKNAIHHPQDTDAE